MYDQLNPRPSGRGLDDQPGPVGFGPRSVGSEHIIAMMDTRSSSRATVWVGGDGRIHQESEHPPLSVYTELLIEVYDVAERRDMSLPDPIWSVRHLTGWLDRHVNWITTQDSVVDFAEILRLLHRQLRPAIGESPRKPFGRCPELLDEGGTVCGGPLFTPPISSSIIVCQCGAEWDRKKGEWDELGKRL
jgi:hypothetical protein